MVAEGHVYSVTENRISFLFVENCLSLEHVVDDER